MNARHLFIVLVACALGSERAASQTTSGPHPCIQAATAPACRTFVVFETGVGRRRRNGRGELDLSWQAGALVSRGRYAVGAMAFAAVGLDVRSERPLLNSRFGVLPRYRRWLSRSASLDLSAGPVVELRSGAASLLTSADVALGWGNDIALNGRVDLGGMNGPAWYTGVRVGAEQVTEVLEAQAIGLVIWGIVRSLDKSPGH